MPSHFVRLPDTVSLLKFSWVFPVVLESRFSSVYCQTLFLITAAIGFVCGP
jgi:hypothetical protein